MANKRRSSTLVGSTGKKSRGAQHSGYEIQARTDPTTGQQSAFPGLEGAGDGLDYGDADGLFYGPAEDGLAYLKMVRAEAAGVPGTLLAPTQPNASSDFDSSQGRVPSATAPTVAADVSGFWSGEAIVAEPSDDDDELYARELGYREEEDYQPSRDPQEACYDAMIHRFYSLRESLANASSRSANETAGDVNAISGLDPSLTVSLTATQNTWYRTFSYCKPTTRFIAALGHSSVMLAFERLDVILTKRNLLNPTRRQNFGAWLWSLLARCRDQGQLTGEETAVLRSLAKSALGIERKLRKKKSGSNTNVGVSDVQEEEEKEEEEEEDEDEGEAPCQAGEGEGDEATQTMKEDDVDIEDGEIEDNEEDLVAARGRLLGLLQTTAGGEEEMKQETTEDELLPVFMMLDSIVTIVGSVFGQRDLLDLRAAW